MALTPYLHAFGIGAAAGARALTPAAMLLGGGSGWARGAKLLAVGELFGDKLPVTPSRLSIPSLGVRALSGAVSGGAVAARRGGSRTAGVALGIGGALAGAWLGYTVRARLVQQRGLPDAVVALGEDALTLALAYVVTRTAS